MTIIPIKEHERWTAVTQSLHFPLANNSLFAKKPFRAGEILGEFGGKLFKEGWDFSGKSYVTLIPVGIRPLLKGRCYLDSEGAGGGNARFVNFAPRLINGKETHMQNTQIKFFDRRPYIALVATKDIGMGEECFTCYGHSYDYSFMNLAGVRESFCKYLRIPKFRNWSL